jgi:hypothetical protein
MRMPAGARSRVHAAASYSPAKVRMPARTAATRGERAVTIAAMMAS